MSDAYLRFGQEGSPNRKRNAGEDTYIPEGRCEFDEGKLGS
jgi:hypothetical protein